MSTITLELEEHLATENGYPSGYWKLFASMEDNSGFEAPDRSPTREIGGLDET
jgi:hypothetical protein